MSPGRTILSSKIDDLKMRLVPLRFGDESLQVTLSLLHVLAVAKTPPVGQAMDVGVNGKRRLAEPGHHDRCGFVSDGRQRLKLFKSLRHFTIVFFDKNF